MESKSKYINKIESTAQIPHSSAAGDKGSSFLYAVAQWNTRNPIVQLYMHVDM